MAVRRDRSTLKAAWIAALSCLAAVQIALGLAGLAASAAGWVEWHSATSVRDWQRAIEIVAFAGLAAYVIFVARDNARAVHFGAFLLLIAVFFAYPPLAALELALPDPAAAVVAAIAAVPIDAFTPAVAWLFIRDFPRALEWRHSAALVDATVVLCVAAAIALVAANLAIAYAPSHVPGAALFDRSDPWSHYWTIVFGLQIPLLPFVVWRSFHASPEERGRVRIMATGFAIFGVSPVLYAALPPLAPALGDFARGEWAQTVLVPVNLLMLLGLAATTTYSVLVDDVLEVRAVLRLAAQYGLARALAWTLAAAPFAAIVALLYEARSEPLQDLGRGARPLQILGLAAIGFAALRLRRRVMLAVDRIFFREPYDAQRILASVAARSREAGSTGLLASVVADEIDRALHVESVALLAAATDRDEYVPVYGAIRRLESTSPLVKAISDPAQPHVIDVGQLGPPLDGIAEHDRQWLADCGASVLVPLAGAAGALTGILVVGPKSSQLPFSREDLLLLEALGSAAGLALENRILRDSSGLRGDARPSESKAGECIDCGRVDGADGALCPECGGSTRPAALPRELLGKFALDRRAGQGGEAIVYRARDLALGRDVALKTLPATSPEDSARLRREARAMAVVTHPNLALIHGAETWKGTPVLVMEYLAGGTLEDKLRDAPMPASEALALALDMAGVLATIHAEGLLHRDVKPSNIGFTAGGDAKLLDFGLARIATGSDPVLPSLTEDKPESGLGGTPLYMSPEALLGARPEPGFDLWSLAIVTCEMICGAHPFEHETWPDCVQAIEAGWNDDCARALPRPPGSAQAFFERSLAPARRNRPATAGDFAAEIRAALQALG